MQSQSPHCHILGVGVSALTFVQARDLIVGVRGTGGCGYLCLATAHGMVEAHADPALRKIFNAS